MSTIYFGNFSLFVEQDYKQQTGSCLWSVRANK